MIRVLLVDDHPLVRFGLHSYLNTEVDLEIIGEAENGKTAVAMAAETKPDVILMDLLMPEMNGLEATEAIMALNLPIKIVVLTSSLDDEKIIQALRCGAAGYILKTTPAAKVADSIRAAAAGESVLDAEVQKRVIQGLQQPSERPLWQSLTDRELDVLRGIATGKNNQEIADWLGIGVKTVKTHVSNILSKLDVLDRTQAAIYALKQGIA